MIQRLSTDRKWVKSTSVSVSESISPFSRSIIDNDPSTLLNRRWVQITLLFLRMNFSPFLDLSSTMIGTMGGKRTPEVQNYKKLSRSTENHEEVQNRDWRYAIIIPYRTVSVRYWKKLSRARRDGTVLMTRGTVRYAVWIGNPTEYRWSPKLREFDYPHRFSRNALPTPKDPLKANTSMQGQ